MDFENEVINEVKKVVMSGVDLLQLHDHFVQIAYNIGRDDIDGNVQ